jgi:hypothetical protein
MIPDRELPSEPHRPGFVYHESRVRRGFSIFLVLFFGLGPLTTLSPASDDAALPACCRRNGAHHCAMYMHMALATMVVPPGAPPIAKTPSHCPYYPLHATVRTAPVHMLAAAVPDAAGLLLQVLAVPAAGRAPLLNPFGPTAVRGPPAFPLA